MGCSLDWNGGEFKVRGRGEETGLTWHLTALREVPIGSASVAPWLRGRPHRGPHAGRALCCDLENPFLLGKIKIS